MQPIRPAGLICLALCLSISAGCSRAYWRQNADAEAYGLIYEKTYLDGRWAVPRTDVIPSPLSRLYDPADPDYGPLPPDDPAAHRYMHQMSDCDRIDGSHYWEKIGSTHFIENPAWVASLPVIPGQLVPIVKADRADDPKAVADTPKSLPFFQRFAVAEMWASSPLAKAFRSDRSTHAAPEAEETHFVVLDRPTPPADGPIAKPQPLAPQGATLIARANQPHSADQRQPAAANRSNSVNNGKSTKSDIELVAHQAPNSIPAPPNAPPARLADDPTMASDDEQTDTVLEQSEEVQETTSATADNISAANPALPPVEQLTLEAAVGLAYLHGREYQAAIEDLYIAAIDLAFDRFQFDVRFLGIGGQRPGADLSYQGTPDGVQSLTGDASIGVSRLLPAGGQWAVELANQTLWLFSDAPDESSSASSLTFTFIQPLLFAAGRKVVLEELTQSERNVLYAARDLARYRQEFFVQTVTGGGGNSGFLGLLQAIQLISNQEDNIRRLEQQLEVSEANEENTDVLSRTQLRSTLLRALNSIRTSRRSLQDQLDQFKIDLGLPPDLALSLDTAFLEPFQLNSQDLFVLEAELEDDFRVIWADVDPSNPSPAKMLEVVEMFRNYHDRIVEEAVSLIEEDSRRVDANMSKRLAALPEPIDENRQRIEDNRAGDRTLFEAIDEQLQLEETRYEAIAERLGTIDALTDRELAYRDVLVAKDNLLRIVRNIQGTQVGLRTELIALNPFEMPMEIAVGYALTNRVDLMNQRAVVTDARRKVEVAANALRAVLDVRVEQEFRTRPLMQADNPLDFRRTNSTFRAGLNFVAPLDQIQQRNAYRVSQINYQRARRDYMLSEDSVKYSVRQAWRQLEVLKQNFEVTRFAVRVAAQQYDNAVEQASNPNQQAGRSAGQSGLNVINALNSVLQAQNDLIGIWVQYESARLNIYRDMGIMEIDARGLWVDPFYQNGMKLPDDIVEGPPGWSGSPASVPELLPQNDGILPIPPAPAGDSGVKMDGGAVTRDQPSDEEILPASFPPGRLSQTTATIEPANIREAGHVRSRRSVVQQPGDRHAHRSPAVRSRARSVRAQSSTQEAGAPQVKEAR